MIRIKRAYEPATETDGARFLVDHLWPRGVKKETLKLQAWLKAVSPSPELRNWFAHDPARWLEFNRRYSSELDQKPNDLQPLLQAARHEDVTLVFAARDTEHNNAVVLKSYLEERIGAKPRRTTKTFAAG